MPAPLVTALRLVTLWLVGTLSLFACGDDPVGEPIPEIKNLSFTPTTLAVGTATTLTGGVDYTDSDGDITGFYLKVTAPSGAVDEAGLIKTGDASDKGGGRVSFTFALSAPLAGHYQIELWVVDAKDQASNHLTATLEAH